MTDRHPLRLTPLPADEWDDRARAVLASLIPAARANPTGAGNVLSTLVRHPDLTEAYLPFNAYLLNGSTLSPRIREVALLRVVYRRDCDYLWSHHLPISTPVWAELGRHFTDQQRMDLTFTIGGYCLLAMAVNTFGVEDEKL